MLKLSMYWQASVHPVKCRAILLDDSQALECFLICWTPDVRWNHRSHAWVSWIPQISYAFMRHSSLETQMPVLSLRTKTNKQTNKNKKQKAMKSNTCSKKGLRACPCYKLILLVVLFTSGRISYGVQIKQSWELKQLIAFPSSVSSAAVRGL